MVLALLQLAVAAAAVPSFDCARAGTEVERTICASEELAALDREEARLYRIARAVPRAQRRALLQRQRAFLRERDSCTQSASPLGECVRDAYLGEIAELRRTAGLADDNEGVSFGPNRFECDGGYHDVFVTVFLIEPEQAWLAIPGAEEGQPLVAQADEPERFVGRYATDMLYDRGTQTAQVGRRVCTLTGD